MPENPLIADVIRIVRDAGKVPPTTAIEAKDALVEDLGIDSLDLVGVLLQIQDHYDVVIDDDDVPNLKRVGDLAMYVETHRAA